MAIPNQAPTQTLIAETFVSRRLMSVDALRGFDMFWIIGADALVYALNGMSRKPATEFLAGQLEHTEWEGFHFYDLIFPLFVFLMGISLVFSLSKTIETMGRGEALKRVFRRGVLLYLLGVFCNGGVSGAWPDVRLMGVLNCIAIVYFFGGLFFCFCKPKALVGVFVALLLVYWGLMSFLPIRDIKLTKANLAALAAKAGDAEAAKLFLAPGNPSAVKNSPEWAAAVKMFHGTTNYVTGKFDKGHNVASHIDFQYLPGRKYDVFFDPVGLVNTLAEIASCLAGVFAGLLLRSRKVGDQRKVIYLISFGIAAAALGWLWNLQLPVIKKVWSASFVLVAGGYASILMGVFYLIVDIWQKRAWCQPFVWMGMNSITIYLASNVLGGFNKLSIRLAGGDVRAFLDAHIAKGFGQMVVSLVGLLLAFWFVRFLYRRQIFIRV